MSTNVKVALVALLLGLSIGALIGYEAAKGGYDEPIPTVPLPAKVVPVEVVKIIKEPGPARVVERVHLVTKTVEVPVEKIKEVLAVEHPIGRARLEADKFEGLKDGKLAFGWKGKAICEVAPEAEPTAFRTLFESPFDLTESKAETTIPPTPISKRMRFDLGAGISTNGLLVQVGVAKRIAHTSFLGKALSPDWVGASAALSQSGHAQILVTASKEF